MYYFFVAVMLNFLYVLFSLAVVNGSFGRSGERPFLVERRDLTIIDRYNSLPLFSFIFVFSCLMLTSSICVFLSIHLYDHYIRIITTVCHTAVQKEEKLRFYFFFPSSLLSFEATCCFESLVVVCRTR